MTLVNGQRSRVAFIPLPHLHDNRLHQICCGNITVRKLSANSITLIHKHFHQWWQIKNACTHYFSDSFWGHDYPFIMSRLAFFTLHQHGEQHWPTVLRVAGHAGAQGVVCCAYTLQQATERWAWKFILDCEMQLKFQKASKRTFELKWFCHAYCSLLFKLYFKFSINVTDLQGIEPPGLISKQDLSKSLGLQRIFYKSLTLTSHGMLKTSHCFSVAI